MQESKKQIPKMIYSKMVGSLIKLIREERKLSQQEMADILGLKSYATVMQYESGKISMPAYYLKRMSEALDIDIRELLPKTYKNETQGA